MVSSIEKSLKEVVKGCLKTLGIKKAHASLFLISEKQIQKLNKRFRSKDKPTNVLAFPFPQTFPQPVAGKTYLGEIYLCPSYIKSHDEDIEYMLIHGLLHLLGFNHIKKSDRIKMERIEREIMRDL